MTPTQENSATTSPTLGIDMLAPDFEARTTQGIIRLSDYRGRWVMLFSHPADFTPVCTSEFIAFQKNASKFKALNCDLIGLSIDSLFSHIAWVKDIEARFGEKISFPIIEDISMAIARIFGMIHDASTTTATVRSTFFIDPEGYVRAMIHYPMNVGRSIDELLRVLEALQLTDKKDVATPEGWVPGNASIHLPPQNVSEADTLSKSETGTWYYAPESGDTYV